MAAAGKSCFPIIKYIMFLFNLLFSIGGGALLSVGVWIVVDGVSFRQILSVSNSAIFSGVWLLLFVGGLIFLLGVLGCCGALTESKCLLLMFFFVVLGVFVAEITAGIMAFIYYPKWKCCGINGPEDWQYSNWVKQHDPNTSTSFNRQQTNMNDSIENKQKTKYLDGIVSSPLNEEREWLLVAREQYIPSACCLKTSLIEAADATLDLEKCLQWNPNTPDIFVEYLYNEGCAKKSGVYFWILGCLVIGILVIEVFGLIITCCLYKGIDTARHLRRQMRQVT
uniref:tetraspanin-18-like isoform X2 n=1 Tax=Ciona intestinalis TaxID=7719 RepID=UPI000EF4CC6E|nr:tetraspanin-18-like isoform X2 [Ciona intestinalis]|eukprot:XP_026692373.1 tetraspanin-18-like isoform X2 [Ciona intestinalis]